MWKCRFSARSLPNLCTAVMLPVRDALVHGRHGAGHATLPWATHAMPGRFASGPKKRGHELPSGISQMSTECAYISAGCPPAARQMPLGQATRNKQTASEAQRASTPTRPIAALREPAVC